MQPGQPLRLGGIQVCEDSSVLVPGDALVWEVKLIDEAEDVPGGTEGWSKHSVGHRLPQVNTPKRTTAIQGGSPLSLPGSPRHLGGGRAWRGCSPVEDNWPWAVAAPGLLHLWIPSRHWAQGSPKAREGGPSSAPLASQSEELHPPPRAPDSKERRGCFCICNFALLLRLFVTSKSAPWHVRNYLRTCGMSHRDRKEAPKFVLANSALSPLLWTGSLTAHLGPRFSHLLCLLMVILLFKCFPRMVQTCHEMQ